MKVYLVGGAVRDQLLGYPYTERDWVVVGATVEQLLAEKYQQVGRDFPVFLNPDTKEEYALARTEKKSGTGYYGFDCNFSSSVTIEEDLGRRDLTINAIAMDDKGQLIDPYDGQKDLNDKILRHVSPAFVEDPVRVLRVARFAARYHHLGFKLANETRQLMYLMVKRGELSHLVAERVWQEWHKSLGERDPEQFVLTLRACDALRVVLPEINALFGIPSQYTKHKKSDTGIHTLCALMASLKLDKKLRFAALAHELGKSMTPVSEWPEHPHYSTLGAALIEQLCARLKIPNEFRNLAVMTAKFHLEIANLEHLRAKDVVNALERMDAFRRPQLFADLLLVCDALASPAQSIQFKRWPYMLSECAKIKPENFVAQGYSGIQIKEALHLQRVACVELLLSGWN